MLRPNKNLFWGLSLTLMVLIACDRGEEEEKIFEGFFSEAELAILNRTLNLGPEPFNYRNPNLPAHFRSDEAYESDNTPENNQITNFGATLGRVLFYDKNLSIDKSISCASCHQQAAGFSDPEKFSIGLNGQLTRRNSMTLLNARYYENGRFFWDERARTLEEQALMPIQDLKEMGMTLAALEARLQSLDYYQVLFKKAFGSDDVQANRIALALSQFMRSMVSFRSKFDEGFALVGFPEDEEQMPDFPNFSPQENLGLDIFYRGRKGATCLYCHGSAQHVNDAAKNNGLDLNYVDKGKGEITGQASDNGLFKVPSLRNIALTAPYMHDGRFATLMDVVNHYSDSVQDHPNLNFRLKDSDDPSPNSQVLRLNLSQAEKEALVAFLQTLSDPSITTEARWSDPFK